MPPSRVTTSLSPTSRRSFRFCLAFPRCAIGALALPVSMNVAKLVMSSATELVSRPNRVHTVAASLSSIPASANQVQRRGHDQLKVARRLDPAGELLRQRHVSSDVMPQPLHAVMADDEPQLEGPEPPAQRDLPVPVVNHRA